MQNRFTVKDFFYMLIGGVICLLIFLNITKTNREVEVLDGVRNAINSQSATVSTLNETIANQRKTIDDLARAIRETPSGGLDAEALEALTRALAAGGGSAGTPNTGSGQTTGRPTNTGILADASRFQPGYNPANRNPIQTDDQNNEGLPQQWQTAPDAELPADFAPGDSLILSWSNDAQMLTPNIATDAYSRRVHWYVMEYLINFDLDAPFQKTPGLAQAWEVSDDGLTLTFHLFPNATFSDGHPVTADDVIFTWDLVMNEKMDTAHLRGYIDANVESWEKLDEHTVQFKMKQTYFDAVGICGNLLTIMPKHIYGNFGPEALNNDLSAHCVGSGPYVLEEWRKNDRIVLRRNENYWGPKPPLETKIIRIIPNDLSKLQEFRANNVDMIEPTAEQWTANRDSDWFRESNSQAFRFFSPRGGYTYIGYNLRRPHFADKRTRQALTMLIDRQKLIDTVLEGMGMVISGPFYFKSDQYAKDVEPWPFDPARARELLREVGWEDTNNDGVIDKDLDGDGVRDPFEVTYLLPSGGSAGEKIQRFVQEAFRQGGIKLNLDQLEWSVFLDRLDARNYDMVTLSWTGNPEGDPYQIWHSKSEPNKGSNHVGFINAEADLLIETARRELDYDTRMSLWHEFHRLINEEQPYTFLYGRPERFFLHERYKNATQRDYRLHHSEWYVPSALQVR